MLEIRGGEADLPEKISVDQTVESFLPMRCPLLFYIDRVAAYEICGHVGR